MKDDEYVPQMLVILSDAQENGLISVSEEKLLADNLMDNKTTDIIAARLVEADWDAHDSFGEVNYYGS